MVKQNLRSYFPHSTWLNCNSITFHVKLRKLLCKYPFTQHFILHKSYDKLILWYNYAQYWENEKETRNLTSHDVSSKLLLRLIAEVTSLIQKNSKIHKKAVITACRKQSILKDGEKKEKSARNIKNGKQNDRRQCVILTDLNFSVHKLTFNAWYPLKRHTYLNKPPSWKLHVCLSMWDILVDTKR